MAAAEVLTSPRRYYLLKGLVALELEDDGLAGAWFAKQEAESGVALASDFPSRAALVAAHYHTVEDLTGATVDELVRYARLSRAQAKAALAALA